MKNFIFKSPQDFHKIVFNKLDMLLAEQRHQRVDLADVRRFLIVMKNDMNLQKQVDEFFEEDDKENIPEVGNGNRSSD